MFFRSESSFFQAPCASVVRMGDLDRYINVLSIPLERSVKFATYGLQLILAVGFYFIVAELYHFAPLPAARQKSIADINSYKVEHLRYTIPTFL